MHSVEHWLSQVIHEGLSHAWIPNMRVRCKHQVIKQSTRERSLSLSPEASTSRIKSRTLQDSCLSFPIPSSLKTASKVTCEPMLCPLVCR